MVTAPELARRLGANPKTFRAWLRKLARAGHPLLAAHLHNARWEFTNKEADQVAREYRGRTSAPAAPTPSSRATRKQALPAPKPPAPRTRRSKDPGHRVSEEWMGKRVETLEDLVRPGLRAVCIGINPSPVSVAAGHYYQGRAGQRFFSRLRTVGLLPEEHDGFEDDALYGAGVGFTDIVKRPTPRDTGIGAPEFEHGRELLAGKLEACRPGLVIFTFKKTATKLFGPFDGNGYQRGLSIGGAKVFVMPGPYEPAASADKTLKSLKRRLAA